MTPSSLAYIPIKQRPKKSLSAHLRGWVFIILFNLCCLSVQGSQWIFLPLRLFSQEWWDEAIRYSKHFFAITLIWMTQWFAPTEFLITTDGEYFDRDGVIEKDSNGLITKINLPSKLVVISNHQVYLDWWYLWSFTYWTGGHKDVVIVLKKSLKWIPIIGWGMVWFRFIFLARSWATDSKYYVSQLASIAQRIKHRDNPLTFFLYPEGTLVSSETRPLSQKWAAKSGIPDLRHILLPRTTGLHYALRTLTPRIPELHLLDVTVAYEGIPKDAYGQSYFTLRSVFLDGVPPPKIHLHLKLFHVKTEVPIGDVDVYTEKAPPSSKEEDVISRVDSVHFEYWLLSLWRQKDDLMEKYLTEGTFVSAKDSNTGTLLPVKLRTGWEVFHSCILFGLGYSLYLARQGYNAMTKKRT